MAISKLRVGVIGAGRMGERHCRVYANMPSVQLVGVSDQLTRRGEAVADQYETTFVQDYGDLLAQVDAVSLVTPTHSHFSIAGECIRQGVHVLVEKPVTATIAEAHALADLARRSGLVVQVGHIERFNPAFLELEAIVRDCDVIGLAAHRLSPFDTSGTDTDVVQDLMIHDIDLALTLLPQDVTLIQASGRAARTDAADYAVATLSMADGSIATLTASRITEQKVRLLEITTLGAYITADLLNKSVQVYRRAVPEFVSGESRPLRYRQENLVEVIHIPTAEPLHLELQDFIRCIRDDVRPKVTPIEGLRALEVALEVSGRIQDRNAMSSELEHATMRLGRSTTRLAAV